jgi:ABC-type ATPase involved in cell division
MSEALVRLPEGLRFRSGGTDWQIGPLQLRAGQWAAFVPDGDAPLVDPSGPLARTLFSLNPPIIGKVILNGQDAYMLDYAAVQRLRSRMGFVQGFGGLLSNRNIRDNIALPVSVHGRMTFAEETQRVDELLDAYALRPVEKFKPHEVDGYTRWRACLARGLVLRPGIVVLEGLGDWELDRGAGIAWTRLVEYHNRGDNVLMIAMSRMNPGFLNWFENLKGAVVRYSSINASNKQGVMVR